ncbi:MAG: Dabb family protein [Verrucomicrobiota bacterium]
MIHHIALFQLKPEVTSEQVETMMRQTRSQLLKIGEVLVVQCGRAVDLSGAWGFFFAVDCESMEKLALIQENPIYLKYAEKVLKPNTRDSLGADYETEPGRDIRYS